MLESPNSPSATFNLNKVLILFTFKALNGLALPYLPDLVAFQEDERTLRSTDASLLCVPKYDYKCWSDRAFLVTAHRMWNQLPYDLNSTDLGIFKSNYKIFLFRQALNT